MPSKDFLELQDMSDDLLINELKETEVAYGKLKMDHVLKGLENPLEIRKMRRNLAKLKTEVRARELKAMTPEQLAGRSKIRARRRK